MRCSPVLNILSSTPSWSYGTSSEVGNRLIALIGSTRLLSSSCREASDVDIQPVVSRPVQNAFHQDLGTEERALEAITNVNVGGPAWWNHQQLPMFSTQPVARMAVSSDTQPPNIPSHGTTTSVDLLSTSSPALDCSLLSSQAHQLHDNLVTSLICAAAPAERGLGIHTVVQSTAHALDWVHTTSGLPWWASIPLCTLAMRLALMPISLRQAKIVRTSYMIYREAAELTDKQMGLNQPASTPSSPSEGASSSQQNNTSQGAAVKDGDISSSHPTHSQPSSSSSHSTATPLPASPSDGEKAPPPLTAAQRLRRSQAILKNFSMLRKKCDAPHPIWILINPLLQVPCFILLGLALRSMGEARWPGMRNEGALWFPDLTQVPLVVSTMEAPMGAVGFVLPGVILAMTIATINKGFGASGAKLQKDHAGDNFGTLLLVLPPILYSLTILSSYFKVQQPHSALLHWATSSAFTLGLQVGLQNPKIREALKVLPAAQVQAMLARIMAPPEVPSSGLLYTFSTLPADLVERVRKTHSADVLVVMGAQLSAKHRYGEAMYCLDRAVALHSSHVRAHYSRGQVFSLTGRWREAELSFREAAEQCRQQGGTDAERGQALYCVATALHTQGDLSGAILMYREAAAAWHGSTVVLFSLINALVESGRSLEASDVLEEAMRLDAATPGSPFAPALKGLANRLQNAVSKVDPLSKS